MLDNIKSKFVKIIKRLKNIDRRKYIAGVFCIILLLFVYCITNYRELVLVYNTQKEVSKKLENMEILLGGEAVGIKLLATGVLVMGIDRDDTNIKIGDIILEANGIRVESNTELVNIAQDSNGNTINLKIDRKSEVFYTTIIPKKDEFTNEYKLGLWVKDSSAGVGTVTFYDNKTKKFAALGHGVTETKENYILPITSRWTYKNKHLCY